MKNNCIDANFQRKVFQEGDSDSELFQELTTVEFELISIEDEFEMAFD